MIIKKLKFPELSNKPFVITPLPLPDELFSSWLIRTAYAHHVHPRTFVNIHLNNIKGGSFFAVNADTCTEQNTLETLERKAHNILKLMPLTLTSYSGYLQEKIIGNGINKFLTTLRFCPVCLREDKVPYFRRSWHVVFNTICLKHLCYLYDSCPNCSTKLNISKMFKNNNDFTYCYKCGFELKKSRKQSVYKSISRYIKSTKKLSRVMNNGYIILNKQSVYSFHFFEVINQLIKLILIQRRRTSLNKKVFKYITQKKFSSAKPAFHQLTIKEQLIVFAISMKVFDNYPNRLKNYILQNNLSHWELTKDMAYIPFWYEEFINKVNPKLVSHSTFITKQEIDAAKRYLKSKNMIVNKANLTRLLGCNFFSSYNNLSTLL